MGCNLFLGGAGGGSLCSTARKCFVDKDASLFPAQWLKREMNVGCTCSCNHKQVNSLIVTLCNHTHFQLPFGWKTQFLNEDLFVKLREHQLPLHRAEKNKNTHFTRTRSLLRYFATSSMTQKLLNIDRVSCKAHECPSMGLECYITLRKWHRHSLLHVLATVWNLRLFNGSL